jgi:hypothetical protein
MGLSKINNIISVQNNTPVLKFHNPPFKTMTSKTFLLHTQLGKEIDRLVGERFFLSKEFKAKKCDYMCTRCLNRQVKVGVRKPEECQSHVHKMYQPRSRDDDAFYAKILFFGRKTVSTNDPFPSAFRCYLEEVMLWKDPLVGYPVLNVYYGKRTEVTDEECAHLALSNEPVLTTEDRAVILDYVKRLVMWMHKAVELTKNTKPKWLKPLKKELNRTIRVTGVGLEK